MLEKPEIRLLKGFGAFNFGETAELIRQVFGEPNEVQNLSDDILNSNSLVYHYWDQGCSLFFDSNKNQRFCSVETDNKASLLFETPIFSLQEKELVSLLKEPGSRGNPVLFLGEPGTDIIYLKTGCFCKHRGKYGWLYY